MFVCLFFFFFVFLKDVRAPQSTLDLPIFFYRYTVTRGLCISRHIFFFCPRWASLSYHDFFLVREGLYDELPFLFLPIFPFSPFCEELHGDHPPQKLLFTPPDSVSSSAFFMVRIFLFSLFIFSLTFPSPTLSGPFQPSSALFFSFSKCAM